MHNQSKRRPIDTASISSTAFLDYAERRVDAETVLKTHSAIDAENLNSDVVDELASQNAIQTASRVLWGVLSEGFRPVVPDIFRAIYSRPSPDVLRLPIEHACGAFTLASDSLASTRDRRIRLASAALGQLSWVDCDRFERAAILSAQIAKAVLHSREDVR